MHLNFMTCCAPVLGTLAAMGQALQGGHFTLFPGWPTIPAPELCALGAPETSGLAVCAYATAADSVNATARVLITDLMT